MTEAPWVIESAERQASLRTLSKGSVDAAEPSARYILWDQALAGFGLRVELSGLETYVIRYRFGGGRRGTLRQSKIGAHGKLTPDQARKAAKIKLAEAQLGGDPQKAKVRDREPLTPLPSSATSIFAKASTERRRARSRSTESAFSATSFRGSGGCVCGTLRTETSRSSSCRAHWRGSIGEL